MAGGSWNGNGDIPAHPPAWCKAGQGWVTVVNRTANGSLTIDDVKTSKPSFGFGRMAVRAKKTSSWNTGGRPVRP